MTQTVLSWRVELERPEQDAVRRLVAEATAADGGAPVGEQVLASLTRPAARRPRTSGGDSDDAFDAALRSAARHAPHLLAHRHGVLVGYAHLDAAVAGSDEPVLAELVVAPDQRRKHVGRRLARAVLDAGPTVRVWAHGDREPARALAAHLGLVPRRELLQLRRPLGAEAPDPLPAVPAREDVVVRTYRPGPDDEAVLAVNNAAFAWHPEQGGMTADDLAEQRREAWFDADGFFLAHEAAHDAAHDAGSAELLGFHWTKVHPPEGDDPRLGEVYVVGIAPAAQGRGLGRLLTLVGLHHLQDAGLPGVLLYVEADNTAAVHTYTGLGFTRFHADVAYGRPAS